MSLIEMPQGKIASKAAHKYILRKIEIYPANIQGAEQKVSKIGKREKDEKYINFGEPNQPSAQETLWPSSESEFYDLGQESHYC